MQGAYYNEHDKYAAKWLRELIKSGHIAPGIVDERDIEDVIPDDLLGFTQCHFFAGIGGWSLALRQAGWPDTWEVWTGSCPCQPFSAASKGKGFADERHHWPAMYHLLQQCQPGVFFGEQVSSKGGLEWIDLVHTDLQAEGYSVAAMDLCSAGVGAPHIRQRLYFVAHAQGKRWGGEGATTQVENGALSSWWHDNKPPFRPQGYPIFGFAARGMDNAHDAGLEGLAPAGGIKIEREWDNPGKTGSATETGEVGGFWAGAKWLPCRDKKSRAVEPGTFPLAHGVSARVGRLRGYGNAICIPVAVEFIRAVMDWEKTKIRRES